MKHFKLIKPIWLAAMLLLSSVPLTANAYDFMVDGIPYNINGDSTSVTVTSRVPSPLNGGNYSVTTANIPSSVTYDGNTYSVTSIGSYAFYNCSGLTSVTIPSSVTNIGEGAFYRCSGLTSVDIPNSVTTIDQYAFWQCSGLTSVTIGNSVTSIGYAAFYNCSGLTRELVIPNSVSSIGDYAFSGCSGLTLVTIPNSVTSIGKGAFYGCSGLTSIYNRIDHPSDVTLGSNVFEYVNTTVCTLFVRRGRVDEYRNADQWKDFENIVEASVYDFMVDGIAYSFNDDGTSVTVTYTESWSTNNYSGLTTANIPSLVTYNGITYSVTSIGKGAFYGCSELTGALTIPNSVTTIGQQAFYSCSGLTSINIPNSVTSIGNYAFKGCSGLTSVSIPNSVTSIGDYAFSGCSGLTSIQNRINHPSDVTLGSNVFGYVDCTLYVRRGRVDEYRNADQWKNFKNIVETSVYDFMVDGIAYYFNDDDTSVTVTYTVLGSTNNYSGLTTANIPSSVTYNSITYSVTSIGQRAFYGCSGLTSVTIPNSVTSFGDYAFSGCSGLTSVTIPNSVTTIGSSAFTSCTGLISVTIPNSVTSISDRTFNGCTGLTSITIPNSVTSIGDYAFYGNISLVSVTIPASVDSIGTQAFYVFDFGKNRILTLCGGVKYIGNDAFMSYRGGRNIHTLILKDSVVNIKNLGADPVQIYCYVPTPPECDENSFTRYDGTLHVPENTLVAYATADYWSNFTNLINDAVEPQSVTLNQTEAEIEPGNTLTLTATVFPSNATTNTVTWTTSNSAVATVTNNGLVTAVGFGECDITAKVLDKTAVCHVTVHEQQVIITLDNHELFVGVNKIAWLTPSMSPVSTDLAVQSSNTGVALAQLVNGRVRVIGVSPGVATVTVSSVDGMAQPDSCVVTVEPDFYYLTITIGGHVSVRQKVTPRGAYTYTLAPNDSGGNVKIVKFNGEDVTSQVSNGYYTTPAITQNSTLEITFE